MKLIKAWTAVTMRGCCWSFMWVALVFFFQACFIHCQNSTCHPADMAALNGFLNGLSSGVPGWPARESTSSDCCGWRGITCDGGTRVVRMELGRRSLRGNVSGGLSGLDQLRVLNLSFNSLSGGLPANMLRFDNLQVIDLSFNSFTGPFPSNNSLPSLRLLNVSRNSFTGLLPVLANSPLVTSFVAEGNRFSGPVDEGICSRAPEITDLYLSGNNFSGSLPAGIGNCSNLQSLVLDSNYLVGTLPDPLFGISSLERLSLQDNMFAGSLSDRLGNLSRLRVVDVSFNGFVGALPDVFRRLGRLEQFSATSNRLYGPLPTSMSNVSTLQLLNLRNNSLFGEINLDCDRLVNLSFLDLGSNQFSNTNLLRLANCRELRTLNLARNMLDGPLPDSFKEFQHLSYLSLTSSGLSNLSSALMVLQQCKNLSTLVLTGNFQDEIMPVEGISDFGNMEALIIPNCRLLGSIPAWLRSLGNLQLLDLSWNRLMGGIPDWIGNYENLFYLDLSNNSLSGEIPKSLTQLKSLISRNISYQDLPSDVPFFAKQQNQSVTGLQYNQIENFKPTLDLCDNRFTGSIWPEFGDLKKLHVLLLCRNNLSGSIPDRLSGMRSIEVLDLSYNELSGAIPQSFINLSFLSQFDVSHNQLSGRIPYGGQFSTFQNSSFEGNPGLCGDHWVPCDQEVSNKQKRKTRNREITIVGMTVGIGLGTALIFLLVFLYISRLHVRTAHVTERNGEESFKQSDREFADSSVILLFHNKGNDYITVDDLLKSTNNFDQANIIGCGGFGLVYKATLPDERRLAVKRLSGDCGQMEREFQAEVDALSKAQHRNLVLLEGYCRYGSDRLLIYSYMEKGSLDYWLHEKDDGRSMLDWSRRLQIAQGAASGLAYLHLACQPHILHRDIKSSNILLDENFEARLADFGLARLILPYDTHVSTDLVGTLGYIPPEYNQASIATFKGDVYSFGVVLLELLTGKRPMDICKPKRFMDLVSWVIQMKKEKKENEVFDPVILEENDKHMQLQKVLEISCLCLNESPKERPSIQHIVLWLDNVCVDA